jgi:hypothetical protein
MMSPATFLELLGLAHPRLDPEVLGLSATPGFGNCLAERGGLPIAVESDSHPIQLDLLAGAPGFPYGVYKPEG